MTRTFIQTHEFSSKWDALGFNDENLRQLENDILKNPNNYPVMVGTGGLHKARVAFDGSGKSSGARACYVDFPDNGIVYLITVFAKNEKLNLSLSERKDIKGLIKVLKNSIGGNRNE